MMGQQRMPADIRRAVAEWAAQGFAVTVDLRAGQIKVLPSADTPDGNPFDQVDMTR